MVSGRGRGKENSVVPNLPTMEVGFMALDHHSEVRALGVFLWQTDTDACLFLVPAGLMPEMPCH